jgi:hypothetical protein
MKTIFKILFFGIILFPEFIFGQSDSTKNDNDTAAYKFIMDYDVPESPAFAILGLNPTDVMRGSSAKPAAINLINRFADGGKLENGIALDFNPYFLLGGRLKSVQQYNESYGMRFLANSQMSFATTNSVELPGSMLYGLGMRFTFFDQRDILSDDNLGNGIDKIYAPALGDHGNVGDDETPTTFTLPKNKKDRLDSLYKAEREAMTKKNGFSASGGFASSGIVRSSILASDSIHVQHYMGWIGLQYSFGNYFSAMANAQGFYSFNKFPANKAGIGLRANGEKVNGMLEVVWGTNSLPIYGGNIEIKLFKEVRYVFTLSTNNTNGKYAVQVKSSLKWNPGN